MSSASVFSLENKCELRKFQVLCGKLHTMLTAQPGLRFPDSNFLSITPQNCLIKLKLFPKHAIHIFSIWVTCRQWNSRNQ